MKQESFRHYNVVKEMKNALDRNRMISKQKGNTDLQRMELELRVH
jgi:hypothetical protein